MPELYDVLVAAGIEIDHHCSDLYFKLTPLSKEILKQYAKEYPMRNTFRNNADGQLWMDVPFAYLPWWRERGMS